MNVSAADRWPRRYTYAKIRAGTVAIAQAPDEKYVSELAERGEDWLGQFEIMGSGFVVDPRGIVITARHTLKEWIQEREAIKQQNNPQAKPSFPKVLSQEASADAFHPDTDPDKASAATWILDSYMYDVHESLDLAAILLTGRRSDALLWPLEASKEEGQVGDEIIAAGFPLGLKLHADTAEGLVCTPSLASGIVSAVLPTASAPLDDRRTAFQFDATIVRGCSGGPVCDAITGSVIGVITDTWEGNDPQYASITGKYRDRFVAYPRAIPLFRVKEYVRYVTNLWAQFLEPTRFALNMGPMVIMSDGKSFVDHMMPPYSSSWLE